MKVIEGTKAAATREGAGVELKDTVGVLEAVMPLGVPLELELCETERVSRALVEVEALAWGLVVMTFRAVAVAWESADTDTKELMEGCAGAVMVCVAEPVGRRGVAVEEADRVMREGVDRAEALLVTVKPDMVGSAVTLACALSEERGEKKFSGLEVSEGVWVLLMEAQPLTERVGLRAMEGEPVPVPAAASAAPGEGELEELCVPAHGLRVPEKDME